MNSKAVTVLSRIARVLAAFIMLQTLYFKFSASEESVYIFTEVGMEPWGRIASGIGELIASVMLLIPATVWLGAALGIGIMSGAIFFHLTTLGIVVMDDNGQLFIYALLVFFSCLFLLILNKEKILKFIGKN